ncbi:MAG: CDP-diacylglycerol--glycerol-3-phosphate 3-phosphatidyltransferase, partial [Clostridia bacterium]|nr:CDP-diacylglycerol--glycerol-3-phosphate 3-phosphatidyltransferase [Clostridia bacterium]
MNLPNKLTMIRILMVPVFVIFVAMHNSAICQLIALVLFIIASLTDLADGKIARSRNLVTDFGKFMDPIADKLLVMSALIMLVEQNRMPGWVCMLILAREFIVSGFRLVAASK